MTFNCDLIAKCLLILDQDYYSLCSCFNSLAFLIPHNDVSIGMTWYTRQKKKTFRQSSQVIHDSSSQASIYQLLVGGTTASYYLFIHLFILMCRNDEAIGRLKERF